MPGTFLERIVGRGVGMKKGAAMQPTHVPYFTLHTISSEDIGARMPENVPVKRSHLEKAMNKNSQSTSETVIMPDSFEMKPANNQLQESKIERSSSDVTPYPGTFLRPKIQKHMPLEESLSLLSIDYAVNIKNDDKVAKESDPAKREILQSHDEHRREESGTKPNIMSEDSPSINYTKRFKENGFGKTDIILKDSTVDVALKEQRIKNLSSKISDQLEPKIKLDGEASAERSQKQSIDLRDRSADPKIPLLELHHFVMPPEVSSVRSREPSNIRQNEFSSFMEISEPVKVQTPISKYEIVSEAYNRELDNEEYKHSSKIMPASPPPSVVSGFGKGSIESREPSNVKQNEFSSFMEISEPVKVQTPISKYEIVSEAYNRELDNEEYKHSSKIMPASPPPSVVSGFGKGSIESREPDQVNVSIGSIEIKAEAQPVPLPAVEPVTNYGFGEYERMRRYLSWERGS